MLDEFQYTQTYYKYFLLVRSTIQSCYNMVKYNTILHTALTHWGRVTHICVGKLTIIGSDNGLSPGRRQAIIWTIAGRNIVNWTLGNKLQWNLKRNSYIFIQENAFENVVWKWRPFCLSLYVLKWLRQNKDQALNTQDTPYLTPMGK